MANAYPLFLSDGYQRWPVYEFYGFEHLSQAFCFTILADVPNNIALSLCGQPLALHCQNLAKTDVRYFHGMVSSVATHYSKDGSQYTRLRLEPWTTLWRWQNDHRIFRDINLQILITQLMESLEQKAVCHFDLLALNSLPQYSVLAQHGETTYDFFIRCLAVGHINYCYDMQANHHSFVALSSYTGSYPQYAQTIKAAHIDYKNSIQTYQSFQYDFKSGLTKSTQITSPNRDITFGYQQDWPETQGQTLFDCTKERMQQQNQTQIEILFTGDDIAIRPGLCARGDDRLATMLQATNYLVTDVFHYARYTPQQPGALAYFYQHQSVAIPRPTYLAGLTPITKQFLGAQKARMAVQLPDEAGQFAVTYPSTSTPSVLVNARVLQRHVGDNQHFSWGGSEQEVILNYRNGDIAHPIILGALYQNAPSAIWTTTSVGWLSGNWRQSVQPNHCFLIDQLPNQTTWRLESAGDFKEITTGHRQIDNTKKAIVSVQNNWYEIGRGAANWSVFAGSYHIEASDSWHLIAATEIVLQAGNSRLRLTADCIQFSASALAVE